MVKKYFITFANKNYMSTSHILEEAKNLDILMKFMD